MVLSDFRLQIINGINSDLDEHFYQSQKVALFVLLNSIQDTLDVTYAQWKEGTGGGFFGILPYGHGVISSPQSISTVLWCT